MSHTPEKSSVITATGRILTRTMAALTLASLLFAVPAFLAYAAGWPLPTSIPTSWASWEQLLTSPLPDAAIFDLLVVAGWLLWGTFVHSVILEARLVRRRPLDLEEPDRPRRRFSPIRGLAGLLVATIAAGTVATVATTATASPASARPPTRVTPMTASAIHTAASSTSSPSQATHQKAGDLRAEAPALPAGLGVLVVNGCPYVYEVERGDTLWHIAAQCLGDPSRWTEIWELNQGRYWLEVSGYTRLNNPDVIYPRWTLNLPADATAPSDTEVQPTTPPPQEEPEQPPPQPTETPNATPNPTTSATPSAGPGGAAIPSPATTSTPIPTTPPPTTPSPTTSPPASPPASRSQTAPPPRVVIDDDGVQLPGGSWIPWALAAALSGSAVVVWLQRRRRYQPGVGADEVTSLPEPLPTLQRVVRKHLVHAPASAEHSTATPARGLPWPPGGIGLVGNGAHGAARAAMVAALASGHPEHPDSRTEVITDASTLATLFGAERGFSPWARLCVTNEPAEALTLVDERILHRSRILDEHSLTDLDTLRENAPSEEPLPPILHIAPAPDDQLQRRSVVTNTLAGRLNITTIYLGPWAAGTTITVAEGGTTDAENGDLHRVATLDPETTTSALITLREAHTGDQPTAPAATAEQAQLAGDESTEIRVGDTDATATATAAQAMLRTMGEPGIDTITRGLRAKAAELAVYLACHPDGAAVRDVAEYLLPDVTLHAADQQIHTNASNLRQNLAKVGGRLLKYEGRYRLDPVTVRVDIWVLRQNLRAAVDAEPEQRRRLLQEACELCVGPLAKGQAYEWVEPHAETVRRWTTKAHLLLAEDLLPDDPQAAADLVANGIRLDRYNEQLYCAAMRAHHALHDAQGIRTLLRTLTKVLAEIDAQPEDGTHTLAKRLLSEIGDR